MYLKIYLFFCHCSFLQADVFNFFLSLENAAVEISNKINTNKHMRLVTKIIEGMSFILMELKDDTTYCVLLQVAWCLYRAYSNELTYNMTCKSLNISNSTTAVNVFRFVYNTSLANYCK